MKNDEEWVTGQIKISISGHPLEMEVTVPKRPVTAKRMLPVFQQMSNSFIQISVDSVEANGEEISCKMGCGACCRQPVPLSQAEVYEIAKMVEEMPEPRQSKVKEKFQKAVEHFAEIGWFEKLEKTALMADEIRQEAITEYFEEGIPCPFLEDESCSIHQNRPLVCREYLVTSPAEYCDSPSTNPIRGIVPPVKPSATLCAITRSEDSSPVINFIPLILSLYWAERFPEKPNRKTGEEWMAEFFGNLAENKIPEEAKNK